MAGVGVYKGWQTDLLAAAKLPDTAPNRQFLTEWHNNADSDCKLNPIDLTHPYHSAQPPLEPGSKNCKATGFNNASYQAYEAAKWTRRAFVAQLKDGSYSHIRAALSSGDPFTYDHNDRHGYVTAELGGWYSFKWSRKYGEITAAGGAPPTLKAPQALRAWTDLQRAVNRHLPEALAASQHARSRTLRELARVRKVKV